MIVHFRVEVHEEFSLFVLLVKVAYCLKVHMFCILFFCTKY